mmetsp:Transcript_63206/g.150732  ORF Transcript_63206/g.150732 Transcript_63206/m.150732 type:complete len:1126 (-) Transcript_63206:176-3553(-)|eukprot:CAMPEP_0178387692 /NCGR_PEP_ID=MMETSP0689_2-20121128/9203_1 /TAXON_ID=160604 /ORGANISM="Amphidinium massartii, Strain CS-259" /LENGTH=1125 /DNA_ID=CAMNT_0020008061 /DNA_START=39 /DNA_END=3416 /DNA_ORIENTATION=+
MARTPKVELDLTPTPGGPQLQLPPRQLSEGDPTGQYPSGGQFNVLDSLDKRIGVLQRTLEEEMLGLRLTQNSIAEELSLVLRLLNKQGNHSHPWNQLAERGTPLSPHSGPSMSSALHSEIRGGRAETNSSSVRYPGGASQSTNVAARAQQRNYLGGEVSLAPAEGSYHSGAISQRDRQTSNPDFEEQGPSNRHHRSLRSERGSKGIGAAAFSASMSGWTFGLPPSWPKCVTLRSELKGEARTQESVAVVASLARQISDLTETEGGSKESRCRVWDPDAMPMILYDALSVVFLIHDLFVTPYVMVMDVEDNEALQALGLASALYWTFDFFLGFNVGYYKKGELVVRRKAAVLRYIKRWFFPNLVILLFDWLSIQLQSSKGNNPLLQLKVVRILKVFRLIKFFRLARLIKLMDKLSALVSKGARTIVQVLKIAFFVLIYNHLLACIWCWIGRQKDTNTGNHWVDYEASLGGAAQNNGLEAKRFSELSDAYIYISAFHWTVAQMTPGPIDVVAVNMLEKVFNITLLLFGLFFVSIIVSLMSGQVMQLIISQRDMQDKLDKLEHYLRHSKVPRSLAVRVQRQVLDRLGVGGPIKEEDVVALKLLSQNMRAELLYESRKMHLFLHPLFELWHQIDVGSIRSLCMDAMTLMYLSTEDELFAAEQEATCAYVLNRGRMTYLQAPETARVDDIIMMDVQVRVWFCEAALWSNWVHVGRCEARTACHMVALDAKATLRCIEKKAAVAFAIKQYGRNFHVRIVSAVPPDAPYPTDLHVPNTDVGDLAPQYVGIGLFKSAIKRGKLQINSFNQEILEEELRKEKSTLQQNASGDLQRVVAVVALRLMRTDGLVLVQLGKWRPANGISVSAELPGSKRVLGELPHKALQRVIDGDLGPLAKGVVLEGSEQDSFTRDSPKFGMRTTYLRTVHEAVFAKNVLVEELPEIADCNIGGELVKILAIGGRTEIRLYGWLSLALLAELQDGDRAVELKEAMEQLDVEDLFRAHHGFDEDSESAHDGSVKGRSADRLRNGGQRDAGSDDHRAFDSDDQNLRISDMPSDGSQKAFPMIHESEEERELSFREDEPEVPEADKNGAAILRNKGAIHAAKSGGKSPRKLDLVREPPTEQVKKLTYQDL